MGLTIGRIKEHLVACAFDELADIELEAGDDLRVSDMDREGYSARAYLLTRGARQPAWAGLLEAGFPELKAPPGTSTSALVLVRLQAVGRLPPALFAIAFGTSGRHMLASDALVRGFGLRTSLNVMFPRGAVRSSRIRTMGSKTVGSAARRALAHTVEPSDVGAFGVDTLHDVLSRAGGEPGDTETWGGRIGGGDWLVVDRTVPFSELATLCRRIQREHDKTDYTDDFAWIDDMQPVVAPGEVTELENALVARLRSGDLDGLWLDAPELVDPEQAPWYRYGFERRTKQGPVKRSILRLEYVVAELTRRHEDLTPRRLRSTRVFAVDDNGTDAASWPLWKCLGGQFEHGGETYVLDEGVFIRVRAGYMDQLDADVNAIPLCALALPPATTRQTEPAYTAALAEARDDLLLVDAKLVHREKGVSGVELCDLLSAGGHLIHLKRGFGASGLSHLFGQGAVSGELLHVDPVWRREANELVARRAAGLDGFELLGASFTPTDAEVVYGIIARWASRPASVALPFFSKIHLRQAFRILDSHGYRVALAAIDVTSS